MTFSAILADIYRRTGFASSPASDVVTRIKAFVNETQQEILHEPGMEFLQNDTITFASVADQQTYGLPPVVTRIKNLWETTNRLVLLPMSLGEYRERYPDPAAVTGTPTRWVDLGLDAVSVEPSDSSTIFVVSSAAGDTGTAYIEGIRSGGYPFIASVTMTGATAVSFTQTDVLSITKFYLSAAAVGTVTLREDSGTGTTLATIAIAGTYSRYRRIALAPTPAASITYTVECERAVTDLLQDNDEPIIPLQFHHLLAIGARAKEYEKTHDGRWGTAKSEYDKALRKLKFWIYQQTVGQPNLRGARISRPSIMDGGSIPASGSSSSPLAVISGGTGFGAYTIGDLLYADTAATLAKRVAVASGQVLASAGVGVAPAYTGSPDLSGTLDVTGAVVFDSTLTVQGAASLNGAVALGNAAADSITVPGTIGSNLLFTDATFDVGASGATRPRDLFLSRNAVIGGTLGVTGVATLTGQGVFTNAFQTGAAIAYINDNANAGMTTGLTINQGAADNEIIALKSSDIIHGLTTQAESDTFGLLRKTSGANGGLEVFGISDTGADGALYLRGSAGDAADATKSTAGNGVINVDSSVRSGTDVTAVAADGNLITFQNSGTTRFILDADGDSHQDVGTAWTNFDSHDDIRVLNSLALEVSRVDDPWKEAIRQNMADSLDELMPREAMRAMKLVSFNDDGHHFVNMSKLAMLHTGAIRQLGRQLQQLEMDYREHITRGSGEITGREGSGHLSA